MIIPNTLVLGKISKGQGWCNLVIFMVTDGHLTHALPSLETLILMTRIFYAKKSDKNICNISISYKFSKKIST